MGKIYRRIATIAGKRIKKSKPGTPSSRYERGKLAENTARKYLQKNGLVPLQQNYRGPGGEIDLIMMDRNIIVFIEVRYRASQHYLHPVESIDTGKRHRIIQTGQYFLQVSDWKPDIQCRFDVVTVTGDLMKPELGWIKNAFQA